MNNSLAISQRYPRDWLVALETNNLSSDDAKIVTAAKQKAVGDYSPSELTNECLQMFEFISKDIGLKRTENTDFNYSVIRIADILQRYFPILSLAEVKLAFELLVVGQLGQIEHYQQLSVDYVCKVLNAYKLKQQQALANAVRLQPKPQTKQLMVAVPEPKTICRKVFDRYKETGVLTFGIHEDIVVYNFLHSKGLIPKIEITEQDRAKAIQRVLAEVAEGKRSEVQGKWAKIHGLNSREIEVPSYDNALHRTIKNYFDKLLKK